MPDFKLLPSVNGTDVALETHVHLADGPAFAPVLWLDAGQITGLADGAAVGTWPDASGNGRNATQASAGKKPLYRTGVFNGRPVVRFDGTDDTMACAAFGSPLPAPTTRVVVLQTAVTLIGHDQHFVSSGDLTNRQDLYVDNGTDTFGIYAGGSIFTATSSNNPCVVATVVNGASSSISLNGTISVGNAGTNLWGQVQLGSLADIAAYFQGDLAEVIVYDRALSVAEQQQLVTALSVKYAIGAASPGAFATAMKWGTD